MGKRKVKNEKVKVKVAEQSQKNDTHEGNSSNEVSQENGDEREQ